MLWPRPQDASRTTSLVLGLNFDLKFNLDLDSFLCVIQHRISFHLEMGKKPHCRVQFCLCSSQRKGFVQFEFFATAENLGSVLIHLSYSLF